MSLPSTRGYFLFACASVVVRRGFSLSATFLLSLSLSLAFSRLLARSLCLFLSLSLTLLASLCLAHSLSLFLSPFRSLSFRLSRSLCLSVSLSLPVCLFLSYSFLFLSLSVSVCLSVCLSAITVPLSLPRFTPEGVASVAQWGLLALIGYWLLTVILRLFIGLLRQVFWILKTVAALWLFGLIVSDAHAGTDTTAIRLAGLVLGCALLGVAFPSSEKTVGVEGRLGQLEGRVRALEGRKGED